MTRNIIKPVTRNGPAWSVRTWDDDAVAYIAAVEAADGAALPTRVPEAINSLIVGCKADGTWAAIKAACLLTGPRTLVGSLVPLAGDSPTNVNFVSGDYSPQGGLKGNGSTKYLDSNRNNNAEPQNNRHLSFWQNDPIRAIMGAGTTGNGHSLLTFQSGSPFNLLARLSVGTSTGSAGTSSRNGLSGASRSNGTGISFWNVDFGGTTTSSSAAPISGDILVYANGTTATPANFLATRLRWYSIGEAIDLELLNNRLVAYMAAVDGASY
jgi:hypothetical protein